MLAVVMAMAATMATSMPSTDASGGATTHTTGPQVNVTSKPADDPDRVICRNEPVTGSRFNKRICLTKAQMDERDRETEQYERQQQNMTGMQSHSTNAMGGS